MWEHQNSKSPPPSPPPSPQRKNLDSFLLCACLAQDSHLKNYLSPFYAYGNTHKKVHNTCLLVYCGTQAIEVEIQRSNNLN